MKKYRIYIIFTNCSHLDKKAEFNRLFINSGIDVYKLNLTEESLEEYFTELIN